MNELYKNTLGELQRSFDKLCNCVAPPEFQKFQDGHAYRFKERGVQQAIIQKLARLISGLKALSLLNEEGLLQEQSAVQRMVDEFEQDAIFLSLGIIENNETELHKKYLEAFYEEEFDKDSAIESTQKRPMIPRKKIIAFLSKDRGSPIDPSTSRDVATTVSKTYSGYVHGASPHIMEMCYGVPPRFHTLSCSDSPLFEDHKEDLLNYLYRGICAFAISAKALGLPDTCNELMKYSIDFAEATGTKDQFINPKNT